MTRRDSLRYANNDGQTCQRQANQKDTQEEEVGAGGSEWTRSRAAVIYQGDLGRKIQKLGSHFIIFFIIILKFCFYLFDVED